MRIPLLVCALIVLLNSACNELEDCQFNPYLDYMVIAFKTEQGANKSVTFNQIVVDSQYRIPFDDVRASAFAIPMEPFGEEVDLIFYTDSINYSMTVAYQSAALIYDPQCDAITRLYGLTIPETTFDSTAVIGGVDSELNSKTYAVNIEIFM
ncbi:MAG: hypothetical protein JXQ90_12585 [Cyclobacteriaceae bacterium]